jgi:predicted oxidoreductase
VILNGSHRYADGRLHDAAAAVGAAVTHLDWQWNYAAGTPLAAAETRPRPSLIPPKSALWLNARGERIGLMPLVSGFDTHDLVARICREPGGYSWQLLNRRIALRELAVSGAEFNPAIRDRKRFASARDPVWQPLARRRADPEQRGHRAGRDASRSRPAHERAEWR